MIKYLKILSDIHVEFHKFQVPKLDTDSESVLVLAGDIGVGVSAVHDVILECYDRFHTIIYVLGNHEYYGHDINQVKQQIVARMKSYDEQRPDLPSINDKVFVVDSAEVIAIEGHKFVCGTLWTDMNNDNVLTHNTVGSGLYDFVKIRNGDRKFTTHDARDIFKDTIEKFKGWVDADTIVVTHHMPHPVCIAPEFRDGYHMNGGFSSDLHTFIVDHSPKIWIHGHGHNKVNVKVHETRIIANPRGYPRYNRLTNENEEFDPNLVIEL